MPLSANFIEFYLDTKKRERKVIDKKLTWDLHYGVYIAVIELAEALNKYKKELTYASSSQADEVREIVTEIQREIKRIRKLELYEFSSYTIKGSKVEAWLIDRIQNPIYHRLLKIQDRIGINISKTQREVSEISITHPEEKVKASITLESKLVELFKHKGIGVEYKVNLEGNKEEVSELFNYLDLIKLENELEEGLKEVKEEEPKRSSDLERKTQVQMPPQPAYQQPIIPREIRMVDVTGTKGKPLIVLGTLGLVGGIIMTLFGVVDWMSNPWRGGDAIMPGLIVTASGIGFLVIGKLIRWWYKR